MIKITGQCIRIKYQKMRIETVDIYVSDSTDINVILVMEDALDLLVVFQK